MFWVVPSDLDAPSPVLPRRPSNIWKFGLAWMLQLPGHDETWHLQPRICRAGSSGKT
jgi:hypothetical protein